jgi:hypothetical protein
VRLVTVTCYQLLGSLVRLVTERGASCLLASSTLGSVPATHEPAQRVHCRESSFHSLPYSATGVVELPSSLVGMRLRRSSAGAADSGNQAGITHCNDSTYAQSLDPSATHPLVADKLLFNSTKSPQHTYSVMAPRNGNKMNKRTIVFKIFY